MPLASCTNRLKLRWCPRSTPFAVVWSLSLMAWSLKVGWYLTDIWFIWTYLMMAMVYCSAAWAHVLLLGADMRCACLTELSHKKRWPFRYCRESDLNIQHTVRPDEIIWNHMKSVFFLLGRIVLTHEKAAATHAHLFAGLLRERVGWFWCFPDFVL